MSDLPCEEVEGEVPRCNECDWAKRAPLRQIHRRIVGPVRSVVGRRVVGGSGREETQVGHGPRDVHVGGKLQRLPAVEAFGKRKSRQVFFNDISRTEE